ncbi:signal peptide peptidase SppA [candidate division WOR-3 bacterium]|nr:signal peptide peptidase SppA [candidate division WOR-3 bacterium]
MKRLLFAVLLICSMSTFLFSYESVAVSDNALSTILNPAGLGFKRSFEGYLISPFDTSGILDEASLFLRAGNIGFTSQFYGEEKNYNSFTISLGSSLSKNFYIGSGYRWFTKIKRSSEWDIGLLYRPLNLLSIGITGKNINSPGELYPEYIFGLGVRPFGNRFTISLDASLNKTETVDYGDEFNLTVGAKFEPIKGFIFKGHYSENNIGAGFGINLSNFGIESYANFNEEDEFVQGYTISHFSADRYRTVLKSSKKYWLEMSLKGPIIEEQRKTGIFGGKHPTLKEILDIIDKISNDTEIEGIYLEIAGPQCGFAKKQEIRKALAECKRKGKKILCYSQSMGNSDYYLASVADSIFMPPLGFLGLSGIYSEIPFIKGTLDKIGIEPELEQIGEYKSAADIITKDSMTTAHREVTNAILDDLFSQLTIAISEARGIEVTRVKNIIDEASLTTNKALDNGLIDELLYEDEVRERFKKGKVEVVPLKKYMSKKEYVYDWQPEPKDKIAIIYATGNIVSGKNGKNLFAGDLMGSETIVNSIRSASKDKNIKAIILRIDSGGGSGLASDMIWREIKKTTEEKDSKPFIVSMSDVAGSGGYYIACEADIILAEEGTITGSIGVISGKFNLKKLYDKIGLRFETIEKGKHAAMFSLAKPFSEEEKELIKKETREFYEDFIRKVAEGRNLSITKVDSVGRGRIWTGNQAKDIGLIDEIGGLREALKLAKEKAGISEDIEVGIEIYPKYQSKFFGLGGSSVFAINEYVPENVVDVIADMAKYKIYENENILYIMPYSIGIE